MLEQSAVQELQRGIAGTTGTTVMSGAKASNAGETVVGTLDEVRAAFPGLQVPVHIAVHGFWLKRTLSHGQPVVIVAGSNDHGTLFGAFDLHCATSQRALTSRISTRSKPTAMSIRWVDEWDNASGTIERGCGGRSDFL